MERMVTAVEILEALHEIFGKQSEQARIELTRKYTFAKMKARTSVRDHVIMMRNYFTDAEFHGAQIDEVTLVGIILNSLSHDFIQFTSNYIMNKLNYGLSQLLNELQAFEAINKGSKSSGSANVASSSRAKSMKKKGNSGRKGNQSHSSKGKGSKGEEKINKSNNKPNKAGKGKNNSNGKGKCFHCDQQGHWKRNCPFFLAELKKKKEGNVPIFQLHVIEANFIKEESLIWIIDSRATNHVCSYLQMLNNSRKLKDGEFTLIVGNRESVSAKAVGQVFWIGFKILRHVFKHAHF